jgi:hypothetical protein
LAFRWRFKAVEFSVLIPLYSLPKHKNIWLTKLVFKRAACLIGFVGGF